MVSDAGVYNAAGAEFDYRRIDDAIESSDESTEGVTEWITATGPIKEEIRLMVTICHHIISKKLFYELIQFI